jgi:two-component system, OmpR family, response regulator
MTDRPLKKILHVEDEADIRTIAKLALEAFGGFEVESCDSGVDALAKAPVFQPDLVLLDVMMPGMDGPMTLEALRKLPGFAQVPAIFMTAKAQPQEIEKLRFLGAIDVVVKPFDPEMLCTQITDIWRRVPTKV